MERSGFFNSSGGDRTYDAVDFAAYFGDLVSNGIFYRDTDNLRVVPGSGMDLTLAPGSAWINGYRYANTAPLPLRVTTANGINPRIDRVVISWDSVARSIRALILTGVAAAVPVAPDITRNDDIYELALADILIPQAATVIVTANITDRRLDASLCGLINSLISAVYE